MRLLVAFLSCIAITRVAAAEAPTPFESRAREIVNSAPFKAAVSAFDRDFDRFVNELILLTESPAPPFGEKARAEAYLKLLRETGLENAHIDGEGNVLGLWRGRGGAPLLAIGAHLDTVFPEDTDVTVKRAGTSLRAPGVADNTRGLVTMLAMARALRDAKIETAGDILFVGTVGEEGPGDLRGVKHLFGRSPWKDRIARFIALDGTNNLLVANGALGSRRYRISFRGPGGHSWGAFGIVNPAFALGNAMAKLGRIVAPKNPKVSYNIGVVSGGTSVNSIPAEVSMEVDLRSVSNEELAKIDAQLQELVAEAVAEENRARSTASGAITVELKLMGERPSGVVSPESPVLRQVVATMAAFDKVPVWETSSTDANLPISLGIPAFRIASTSPSRAGRTHSLEEWTDVEEADAIKDFSLALGIVLSVANLP